MKIVSNFKDYYDTAVNGYDTDESLIYRRFYEDIGETTVKCPIYGAILFCGEVYPIIANDSDGRGHYVDAPMAISPDDVEPFLMMDSKRFVERSLTAIWAKDPRRVAETNRFLSGLRDRAEKIHIANNAPILAIVPVSHDGELYPLDGKGKWPTPAQRWARRGWKLVKNPCLRDLEFACVVSPWQARQEIEMYLGSVLCQHTMPPVVLNNEQRLEKHGFDRKISFRHRKG